MKSSEKLVESKKNKNYVVLNISWDVSRLRLRRKRWTRDDQEFFRLPRSYIHHDFLQAGFVLFNKSICLTIPLMKYRLARGRMYAWVFRISPTYS